MSRGGVYWRVNLVQRNRPQLVLMCRLLNMSDWATDGILRMQLRSRLEKIKHDDVMIAKETVGPSVAARMVWSDTCHRLMRCPRWSCVPLATRGACLLRI